MGLIRINKTEIPEGCIFNRYLESRLIQTNKNVLLAITGATGSGKSYASLRIAELWYEKHFKKPFPIENCCFSIDQLIRLLNTKDLKRGEVIILEEAGVNLNSLDFQNKISKLFTFVLQSFRSLNLCLIMNLPVLTMLNKSARLLLHASFLTSGINFQEKTISLKPIFLQLNHYTGKVYHHYLFIDYKGSARQVKVFSYGLPTEKLLEQYEQEKKRFISSLLNDFLNKLDTDLNKDKKLLREDSMQPNIWKLAEKYKGKWKTQKELIELYKKEYGKEVHSSQFSQNVKSMRKKGWIIREFVGN